MSSVISRNHQLKGDTQQIYLFSCYNEYYCLLSVIPSLHSKYLLHLLTPANYQNLGNVRDFLRSMFGCVFLKINAST